MALGDNPTRKYLARLSLHALLESASAYNADSVPNGDPVAYVRSLQAEYAGVDRVAVLRDVFARLTTGLKSETAKEKAVLAFVQHLSVHDFTSPFMSMPIFDPLILFRVHAMDCQKDSRMIADMYAASGYESRIVDLYGHAVAEVNYEHAWHYADADMFGGGEVVTMPDGHIPSMAELAHHPDLLDRIPVYLENVVLDSYPGHTGKNGAAPTWTYPSAAYFSAGYFAHHPGYPAYLSRKTMPVTARNPALAFGWNDPAKLRRVPASDIILSDIPSRPSPNAPRIVGVETRSGTLRVTIAASAPAGVISWRIFISKQSRGWDYGTFQGSAEAASYWANPGGWNSGMYSRLFQLPPAGVRTIDASRPVVKVAGLPAGTYFVSVMPIDAYGRSIGRKLYPLSNELRITVAG